MEKNDHRQIGNPRNLQLTEQTVSLQKETVFFFFGGRAIAVAKIQLINVGTEINKILSSNSSRNLPFFSPFGGGDVGFH